MWHHDVIQWHPDIMQWQHDVIWRHMTSWSYTIDQDLISVHSNQKILEMMFFDLVTLTFDLWPWPANPFVKWFSCERANRRTHTHTHTNGSVFITSTADAGGNNYEILCIFLRITSQNSLNLGHSKNVKRSTFGPFGTPRLWVRLATIVFGGPSINSVNFRVVVTDRN